MSTIYRATNVFISILLLTGAIAQNFDFEKEWTRFQKKQQRHYSNISETKYRRKIFNENLRQIRKHNEEYEKGLHRYTKGVNQFTDLTFSEFKEIFCEFPSEPHRENRSYKEQFDFLNVSIKSLPTSIDYRKIGAVTHVKHQHKCSSCYAFAAAGAMEGQYFMTAKKLISFSEQQLVDCTVSNLGCKGGHMSSSYNDVIQFGGIASEESYPYKAMSQNCSFKKNMAVAKVSSYVRLSTDEDDLKRAVALKGPISVALYVTDDFRFYKRGIYEGYECDEDDYVNHGVTIVGYEVDKQTNVEYWIIRNSWGERWGERGYMRFRKFQNRDCFGRYAMYPIMEKV